MRTKYKRPRRWVGWHWVLEDGSLRYDDTRTVKPGRWYVQKHRGRYTTAVPRLCRVGMHASWTTAQAARCARVVISLAEGVRLCLVEVDGIRESGEDKFVGRRRRILAWSAPMTLRGWEETPTPARERVVNQLKAEARKRHPRCRLPRD